MRGFSGRNLRYMATAASAWPGPIAQQPVAQLPWGHVTVLLDKLDDQAERDWHAAAAVEHGWSRNVLQRQALAKATQVSGVKPPPTPIWHEREDIIQRLCGLAT